MPESRNTAESRSTAEGPAGPILAVNVSLASGAQDYDAEVDFLDLRFRIVRRGTDGDVDLAGRLIGEHSADAAAIAITGARDAWAAGALSSDRDAVRRLMEGDHPVPTTTGRRLREVLQEWVVRDVAAELPGYFSNARTVVLGGANHYRTARVLNEFTDNIRFADPALEYGLPSVLGSFGALDRFTPIAGAVAGRIPERLRGPITAPGRWLNRSKVVRAMADADVIVGTWEELRALGLPDLTGKTVITMGVTEERLAVLADLGVDLVIDDCPQPFGVIVRPAMLEAMMMAATGDAGSRLTDDDLLDMITSAGLEPRLLRPNGPRRRSRFAFVIHPLSQENLRNVGALDALAEVAPHQVMDGVEKAAAHLPPFVYSRVTGIRSPTGAEAEGWLITVGGTPRELMAHDPEFTYKRLLAAAGQAQQLGAQIMGLGAFTKVVGDAGVTVAKRAPLPITTGNSYSASGALWALHDAVARLGIAETDEQGRLKGKAMVVGATGAIGSVCARLLAMASDELWLVSPEPGKLLALKDEIEAEGPRARIFVAGSADEHLADMDVIVTATSGAGKRVLDIMRVKPGAVITDVARPLDLSPEDVARRPDVLVVESGEIELPGEPRMRDIGLPPGVVYACMAETIVLALEGRFENYTVGRNIEWQKVKEIYRLGLKHGMGLAAISGVNGVFSDDDIAQIRERALAERARMATAGP